MERYLQNVSGYITDMTIRKNERAHFELVIQTSTGERHGVILNPVKLLKLFPSECDDKEEFLLSFRGGEARNFLWKLEPAIILFENKRRGGISKREYIEILAGLIAIGPNKSYQTISGITFGLVAFSRIKVFITTNIGSCITLTLDWQKLKKMLRKRPSIHKQLEADTTGKSVFLYMLELVEATVEFGCRGVHIPIRRESKAEGDNVTREEPSKPKEEEAKGYPWTKYPGPLPEDMIVGYDKGKEKAPKSKEETGIPQSDRDDSDLRNAIKFCESIFEEKMRLYGASFCYMHPETVTDQLYMKATVLKKRVTDRDKGKRFGRAFFEGVREEFAAIVNYSIIALRQGGFGMQTLEVPESPMRFYSDQMQAALELITEKGAEYGELWREQRIGTLADMIYTKVLRVKRIENQYRVGGLTKEDYHKFAGDQYRDMINYGLFGVVRMTEIIDYLQLEMEDYESDEEEDDDE